jgi:DNA-binding SARP family transcriptional activator
MPPRFRLLTLGGLRLESAGAEVRALRRQERILLVYLAQRSPAAISRAELAALIWGERDEAKARHSLRQALSALRRVFGPELEVSPGSVALRSGVVELDVTAAAEDVRNGRYAAALARWDGDFLHGADGSAAESLREWIDGERVATRQLLAAALDALGVQEPPAASNRYLALARQWAEKYPWDESAHLRLVGALHEAGHGAEAASALARATELLYAGDAEGQSPALLDWSDRLAIVRPVLPPPSSPAAPAGPAAEESESAGAPVVAGMGDPIASHATAADATVAPSAPARRRYAWAAAAFVGAALLALATGALGLRPAERGGGRARAPTVVAIGNIRDLANGSDSLALALPEILSTQLAGVGGAEVVSRARMHELFARWQGSLAAARASGATELIEGELARDVSGAYRLDLRRIAVPTGRLRNAISVKSSDGLDLAHRAAVALAASLDLDSPPLPPRQAGAIAARALYEEGLRALTGRRNYQAAYQLFTAALERDSTFAMAALRAGLMAVMFPDRVHLAERYIVKAERLAHHEPDRDRLIVRAVAALFFNRPEALDYARELVRQYPLDAEGPLLAGAILAWTGDYSEAIAQLELALAMDRPIIADWEQGHCRPCEAYSQLIEMHVITDSLPAAIRTARDWAAAQPSNPAPLDRLAVLLDDVGARAEAALVRRRAAERDPNRPVDLVAEARRAIAAEDYVASDTMLRLLERTSDLDQLRTAAWLDVISLRAQGRYREAYAAASRYRRMWPDELTASRTAATPQAVVLIESGKAIEAVALFDSIAMATPADTVASRAAREHVWQLTLRSMVRAATHDTASLARMADSAEVLARRSAFGRDRHMPHYIRALQHRARGDWATAERAFRAAVYSPSYGFTRTNVDLAQVLIASGRPLEAIPLLRSALRGPIDGTAYYTKRTDVREALGAAFEAAGMADSAIAQYSLVLRVLQRADANLAARIARLRVKVDSLRATSHSASTE